MAVMMSWLEWLAGGDKKLRQIYKGSSFFNNQTSFRLDKLIHNNDGIKMLRFAEQTHNSRELNVSPIHSTYRSDFLLPALVKSGQQADSIVYLF